MSRSLLIGALSLAITTIVGCGSVSTTTASSSSAIPTTKTTAAVAPSTPVAAATPAEKRNPDDFVIDLAGFTAHLSRAAQRHPRRQEMEAVLSTRLAIIETMFPTAARTDLERTPLWFTERAAGSAAGRSLENGTERSLSSAPLFHSGNVEGHPELSNAIEVPSITMLIEQIENGNQSLLSNLLAAGYFTHLSTPPWKEAEEAFAGSKSNLMTAKMGSDPLSYFSALSVAYFGRCALPPEREALRAADPRGTTLVARTWLDSSNHKVVASK